MASDTPQDVYADVAEMVSSRVAIDAQQLEGKEAGRIPHKILGKINNRKIFKQLVMTSVYGVSPFTAKKMIEKSLVDFGLELSPSDLVASAEYLTRISFECLHSMFSRAKDIQKWLGSLADEIVRSVSPETTVLRTLNSTSREKPELDGPYPRTFLSWTTPLGFRVTQPYQKHTSMEQIKTGNVK